MKWSMNNVVFYDGCDAFVSKFILPKNLSYSEKVVEILKNYSNGEILKIDELYDVNFDNIVALVNSTEENANIANKFIKMFF